MIRNVPISDGVYLCHHKEQALCFWIGPLVIRFWFLQKS